MLGGEVAFLQQGVEAGIAVEHGLADSLQRFSVLLVDSATQRLVNPVERLVMSGFAIIVLLNSEVVLVKLGVTHLVIIQAGCRSSLELCIICRERGICEPPLQNSMASVVATEGNCDSLAPFIVCLQSHDRIVEQLGIVSPIDSDGRCACPRFRCGCHLSPVSVAQAVAVCTVTSDP